MEATRLSLETLEVTHLLVVCPRGFRNEREIYPIPREAVEDAEMIARLSNPDGYIDLTRLIPLEDASPSDRKRAGWLLRSFASREDYLDYLYTDPEGPLYTARRGAAHERA